ncbi:hypothetical protein D3C74_316130 [compost metagenome]
MVFTDYSRCNVYVGNDLRRNFISGYRPFTNFSFYNRLVSDFVRLNSARSDVIFLDSLIRHMVIQNCTLPYFLACHSPGMQMLLRNRLWCNMIFPNNFGLKMHGRNCLWRNLRSLYGCCCNMSGKYCLIGNFVWENALIRYFG